MHLKSHVSSPANFRRYNWYRWNIGLSTVRCVVTNLRIKATWNNTRQRTIKMVSQTNQVFCARLMRPRLRSSSSLGLILTELTVRTQSERTRRLTNASFVKKCTTLPAQTWSTTWSANTRKSGRSSVKFLRVAKVSQASTTKESTRRTSTKYKVSTFLLCREEASSPHRSCLRKRWNSGTTTSPRSMQIHCWTPLRTDQINFHTDASMTIKFWVCQAGTVFKSQTLLERAKMIYSIPPLCAWSGRKTRWRAQETSENLHVLQIFDI